MRSYTSDGVYIGRGIGSRVIYDNHCFRANPGTFARNRVILVPQQNDGAWSSRFEDTFLLRRLYHTGHRGGTLALTRPGRNEMWARCWGVLGTWAPLKASVDNGAHAEYEVAAATVPYFIFTNRLGGCAVGLERSDEPRTRFAHDPAGDLSRMQGWDLALAASDYGRDAAGFNVTAFFWWNGTRWSMGRSAGYITDVLRIFVAPNQDNYMY